MKAFNEYPVTVLFILGAILVIAKYRNEGRVFNQSPVFAMGFYWAIWWPGSIDRTNGQRREGLLTEGTFANDSMSFVLYYDAAGVRLIPAPRFWRDTEKLKKPKRLHAAPWNSGRIFPPLKNF